jgi:hypothetical protein
MAVGNGPWYRRPEVLEAAKQVFIALLLAALTVLGYDYTVAAPRTEALAAQMEAARGATGSGVVVPVKTPSN